jgi:hypothetical protein
MRAADSREEDQVEKNGDGKDNQPGWMMLGKQNRCSDWQSYNQDEFQASNQGQPEWVAEEQRKVLCPTFTHGAEAAVHPSAHQPSPMAKQDFMS